MTGLVFDRLSSRLVEAQVRAGLSLLIPYVAYLLAETLQASGVLAVLVAGFWVSHSRRDPDDVQERLYGRSFWEVVEVLVTGFTFALVGLEFVTVTGNIGAAAWGFVSFALLICLVLIVVRFVWMYAVGGIFRYRNRHENDPEIPGNWRETFLVAWAGMRAVVTVATALALPEEFPARDQVLFVAVLVALVTLLLPGLTLPRLVKVLRLNTGEEHRVAARERVVEAATRGAIGYLERLRAGGEITEEQRQKLAVWWRGTLIEAVDEELSRRYPERKKFKDIHGGMLSEARAAALELRPLEPEAVDELLRDLDLRSAVI
jgi:CPA1 family monovalent cation:H+ antiporter